MIRRKILIPACIGLMAGALAIFQFDNRPHLAAAEEHAVETAVHLTVRQIEYERIVLTSEYAGRVSAHRRVEIRPQVGGLILERHVEEGARVSAGDVLFRLDPAPLQADLGVAEAALARAEIAETFARSAAERSDSLLKRNTVSRQSNDTAHNDLHLAKAAVAEARAAVERKRLDLDFATLRAPIDGYVAAGLAEIGGLVTVGGDKPLAVVQDLDMVTIDLRLPADDLDAVMMAAEAGLGPVRVLKDRDGAPPLTGALKSSDVIVDQGTGYVGVRIEVANPHLALLPGMFVRATLPHGVVDRAVLVPEDAILRTGDGGAQIVVVSRDGQAARRDVRLGERVGNRFIVASGLKPGESVAVRGQDRVPEGVTVPATTRPAATSQPDTSS
ncbi:efflux transporter periplasmic adaptor subunit (plasmid) [Alloyangia pacifica]|uniref:Efflux transporter periplasmic adaptor subunit n=1 Tax=Alloyangia pacifica TaxID=311180 RepID=A0A2U8HLY6_9RHOB|nr:efflux RND transporter periplasmic adaptor subunit [Alloyangia pacifica]AWI85945.1 efflux transporter periplasmic adaptor subunit [Alloyangia pacifica]